MVYQRMGEKLISKKLAKLGCLLSLEYQKFTVIYVTWTWFQGSGAGAYLKVGPQIEQYAD